VPLVPINPTEIAPPAAKYEHAVLAEDASRILHTSGIVPVKPDGTVPENISDQAEVIWQNISFSNFSEQNYRRFNWRNILFNFTSNIFRIFNELGKSINCWNNLWNFNFSYGISWRSN